MNPIYSRYYVYIKPALKNRYVKTYSSLVFSLIAITFFSLFAIRPTFKTIIALQKDIEQQTKVLDQIKLKSKNLEKAINNYHSIPPDIKVAIDTLVPSKPIVSDLIKSISDIAKINEASISGLQFQPFEVENPSKPMLNENEVKEINLTFNLQGDYFGLTKTLNDLNNSKFIFLIDSVNLTKSESGMIMSIQMRTYY